MLVGAIQGLIFGGVVLLNKKYRSNSIYYLVALILAIVYNTLQYYLPDVGLVSMDNIWGTIYLPIAALAPVLIYFYVVTSIDKDRKISNKEKLLYLPFLIFLLVTIYFKTLKIFGRLDETNNELYLDLLNALEVVSCIFLFTVLIVSVYKIIRLQKKLKVFKLSVIKPRLDWLLVILSLLILIAVVYGYQIYVMLTSTGANFYALWILETFLVYFLGHIGIYKFGIHEERKKIRKYAEQNLSYSITEKQKNEHITALENILIDEKRFLDNNINLDSIASELNLSKGHLSRVINSELNTSFSDYVNSLRVEEAKSYLLNSEFSNYTLVAIGLEAGFNSKSTFNSAFKKVTGNTPSEFKKFQIN